MDRDQNNKTEFKI